MMKIMTTAEEAESLKARFEDVNRAAFARENNLKGGQAIVYQHITGRRPISLEAAIAYAKGFHCSLEDISPRLAKEAFDAAKHMRGADSPSKQEADVQAGLSADPQAGAQITYIERINESEMELLEAYRLTAKDRQHLAIKAVQALQSIDLPVGLRNKG